MAVLRIGAEQLRRQLTEILSRVRYGGDQVIVERHGTPQAVVIPYSWYEEALDRRAEQRPGPLTEDEIERLLVEKGILLARDETIPPPTDDWQPVLIEGKPLSQGILEERR